MQSAVPCSSSSSNGLKRTAANAHLSDTSPSQSSDQYRSSASGAGNQSSDSSPPEKRSFIVVESPLKLDTIASAEDLDIKVLQIQNKNLSERMVQRQRLEAELREKIDQLQNRKAADDSKLCIVDRYWTQLDEDLRLMLERFDETSDKDSGKSDTGSTSSKSGNNKENSSSSHTNRSSSQSLRSFLTKLNDWDKVEIEDKLKERVKFTTQTVSKLMINFDKIMKKKEMLFYNHSSADSMDTSDNSNNSEFKSLYEENCRLNELITKCQQKLHSSGMEKKQLEDRIDQLETEIKELTGKNDETEYELEKTRDKAFKLDRQLADTIIKLNNLQKNAISHHNISNNSNNNNNSNSNNHVNNHFDQNGHVVLHNNLNPSRNSDKSANLTEKQLSDIESESQEQRELAASRLQELEKLNLENQSHIRQIEKLKADLKTIPESVIEQSSEYKMLQTKYSLIVNDNIKLKQALDETRNLLEMSRITFQRQLEQMESEELAQQKRLGTEMMQLEEQLSQVRKENEMLRIEYEQNVAANEQTGPINKEMRSLITTLQTNNKLLKSDNTRTKKRLEETQQELERVKKQNTQLQTQLNQLNAKKSDNNDTKMDTSGNSSILNSEHTDNNNTSTSNSNDAEPKKENTVDSTSSTSNGKDMIIKDLKEQNKKLQENQKDMKNLLDIYSKSNKLQSPVSSTSGSSNSSSSSSNKYKIELEEARIEIKRLKESIEKLKSNKVIIPTQQIPSSTSVTNSSPSTTTTTTTPATHHSTHHHHHSSHHNHIHDESSNTPNSSNPSSSSSSSNSDFLKKIRSLEETIRDLHKSLNNKKQEESALLQDMEITGQAFEDMQEQNVRLMQQLREKDDANFKLVSERIKLENMQKVLKEEKEIYIQQVTTLQEQQEAQMNVSKKLEDQLALLTQSVSILEKEVSQLQMICDTYKRQAVDNVQQIQDLKLNTQKYLCQLKEAQQQIAEKSEQLASQSYSSKRAQEEIKHLQAKLERQKKYEMASSMDEVLKEEIKEYKEQLRCPSCKVKQKDAVLTKCFHVFCHDCLQKRYESRQRKCPKCNANFGANDFRKLYLS